MARTKSKCKYEVKTFGPAGKTKKGLPSQPTFAQARNTAKKRLRGRGASVAFVYQNCPSNRRRLLLDCVDTGDGNVKCVHVGKTRRAGKAVFAGTKKRKKR